MIISVIYINNDNQDKDYNSIDIAQFYNHMGSCQSKQSRMKSAPKKQQHIHNADEYKSDHKLRRSIKIIEQQQLKNQIYHLFERFDADKDGKLGQSEVQAFLKQLDQGKKFLKMDYKAAAKELITKLDKNQNHGLQNWELYEYYKQY